MSLVQQVARDIFLYIFEIKLKHYPSSISTGSETGGGK